MPTDRKIVKGIFEEVRRGVYCQVGYVWHWGITEVDPQFRPDSMSALATRMLGLGITKAYQKYGKVHSA